jgi:hypothetical protein
MSFGAVTFETLTIGEDPSWLLNPGSCR